MTAVKESGDIIHVSGAVKFATGTSVNLAWAKEETGGKSASTCSAALAHNYGDGSVGIYLKRGSQNKGEGMAEVDSSVFGVGIGHEIVRLRSATVYAGYRVMKRRHARERKTSGWHRRRHFAWMFN